MKVEKRDSAILEWIDKYQIRNSRNDPFEFEKHSFLLDPICDWSKHIAIMKSAQIGFSESFGILKVLFAARYYKLDGIYTLPSNQAAEDFVRQKVNPIIEKNPVIREVLKQDMLDMKQVGDRFLRFKGTHSSETAEKKAESDKAITITSDLNVHDEHDRSDQFVIDQYASRLENSDYAGTWSFSNPSYPGVGCSAIWETSDQKLWMVKCSHCGHQQFLDWKKLGEVDGITDHCKIDVKNREFVCGKCEKAITDTDRMLGEWVATYKDRDISGYWMSQLNYVRHHVDALYKKETDRTPQNFHNFVLGKPYRASTAGVDRGLILRNLRNNNKREGQAFMGVDQGIKKHYVIGDDNGVFDHGITEDWEVIDSLIRKHQVIAVIDALPYRKDAQKLVDKYSSGDGPRVYMCYYQSERAKSQVIEWGKNKTRGTVYVQREPAFDILVDMLLNELYPITQQERELDEYIGHWNTMTRIEKEDHMGILKPKWITSTGKDHYCHASLYEWIASTKGRANSQVGSYKKKSNIPAKQGIEIDDEWTSVLPGLQKILDSNKGESNWIG